MKVKCKQSFREFERGKEYIGKEMKPGVVDIAGLWFEVNHLDFDRYWEVLEPPKPTILSGPVETQEEIEDRIGRSLCCPLTTAIKEIMRHQETIHQLVGARAQQIENNRHLLPIIDKLAAQTSAGVAEIKKFVKAGAVG